MSIHIDRECMFCGTKNPNEIYVNWAEPAEDASEEEVADFREMIRKFYDEWVCKKCDTSQ